MQVHWSFFLYEMYQWSLYYVVCITAVLLNALWLVYSLASYKWYGFFWLCFLWWLIKIKIYGKRFVTVIALIWFNASVWSLVAKLITICSNDLSQWLHWYGLTTVYDLWWLNRLPFVQKICHSDCINMVYPQCVFSCSLPYYHLWKKICHNICINMVYHQCAFSCGLPGYHL